MTNLSQSGIKNIYNKTVEKGLLVYIMLFLLLVGANMVIPGFMSFQNLAGMAKLAAFTGIAAIGQTLVILIGGIDMSISSSITLANIMAAQLMAGQNDNISMSIVAVLGVGALIGAANAAGINYLKIPPMIMTLGLGTVVQGAALLYSKGAPKGNAAPIIRTIVNEPLIGGTMAWVVVLWLMLAIAIIVLLKFTTLGRKIYAVGTNAQASHFTGISASQITYFCFIISGIMAAVTGILLCGYTGTASAEAGEPYSMNSIVSVVIGGTAITGGKGGYLGTVAGAIIMTVLDSMLTVINIPKAGRMIVQGLIILAMVLIYGRDKKQYS